MKRVWLVATMCWLGCTSHADIAGRNAEAEAWAAKEQQRAAAERKQRESQPLPKYTPVAQTESESVPPPPPAPVASSPAPAPSVTPGAATADEGPSRTYGGTCFAIDAAGTIVTARHVIEGARSIRVRFGASEPVSATLLHSSEATDVAVLRVPVVTADFLPLGPAHAARLGLPVFTIGFPATGWLGTSPKFTDGAISALSGPNNEAAFLQTSVAVQPGNSGGPLVDDQGRVVGVMISRADDLAFFKNVGVIPQNINFATKSENLLTVLDAAPATREATKSREAAIALAEKAVCLITASVPSRPSR
jgi:S1-C subfamily serine protease